MTFGDGVQGARLPTGVENVAATYRSGIGAAGMVGRGPLTLLMTRPLGIRGVTNPLGRLRGRRPESARRGARERAADRAAMDRVVSLRDAEDFARAFAGVGKARARRCGAAARSGSTSPSPPTRRRRARRRGGARRPPRRATAPLRTQPRRCARRAPGSRRCAFASTPTSRCSSTSAPRCWSTSAIAWRDVEAAVTAGAAGRVRVRAARVRAVRDAGRGHPHRPARARCGVRRPRGPAPVRRSASGCRRAAVLRADDVTWAEDEAAPDRARAAAADQPARHHAHADAAGGDDAMSERLFDLLPAVYRMRDRAQGEPLRALLARDRRARSERLEADIAGLYDNWFIETCDEWVVPYIGDLLGVRRLLPIDDGAFTQRALRREHARLPAAQGHRRGARAAGARPDRLAGARRGVSSSSSRRRSTSTTCGCGRTRPRPASATRSALQYVSTAVRARHPHRRSAAHRQRPRAVTTSRTSACSCWRLQQLPARPTSTAGAIDAPGSRSIRSVPTRRCSTCRRPRTAVSAPGRAAARADAAAPARTAPRPALVLRQTPTIRSLAVSVAGVGAARRPPIVVCDLSDARRRAGRMHAAVRRRRDRSRSSGRIAFGDAPAGEVTTSHAHGSGGDLGGGPYDQRAALAPLAGRRRRPGRSASSRTAAGRRADQGTLADAVAEWNKQPPGTHGVIVLMDSGTLQRGSGDRSRPHPDPGRQPARHRAAGWPEEETRRLPTAAGAADRAARRRPTCAPT